MAPVATPRPVEAPTLLGLVAWFVAGFASMAAALYAGLLVVRRVRAR